ncbi:MAG: TylF/MycF/NovP-related O-methyltransferase [Bryobacteraceae bacterium]
MKRWIRKLLSSAGYVVFNTHANRCYARDGLFTANNDHYRNDPVFKAAYARGVAASGGVDPQMEWRVHVALWAARTALRAPGHFVECGVNAGFVSSAIMQHLDWRTSERRFYLIDTFSGPVPAQYSKAEIDRGRLRLAQDAIARGAYVTNLERVQANYAEWHNVEIVQGVVPEILPAAGIESVAFLHLDMNCSYPERAALEFFWPRLSANALVLFDDYAYFGNESLTEAIDAAAASLGANVLSLPTGQGLIFK